MRTPVAFAFALAAATVVALAPIAVAQQEAATLYGLPPAGTVPNAIALQVTGSPATDPDVLDALIRDALDRAIRPTLRPNASVRYGPIEPWPLLPLGTGARTAVNVGVTIVGDAATATRSGVTPVTIENVAEPYVEPTVLHLSDDPEYLDGDGVVLRRTVAAPSAARLYYFHSVIGLPRDLDVVLTSATPARVHLITASGGPDLDVMAAGHAVSRDFLRFSGGNQGLIADLVPGVPFVLRHVLLLQGEVAAGAADVHVLRGGSVAVSVVASSAGARIDEALAGPRVAFDGHARHGSFVLDGFGRESRTYVAGGPDVALQYGGRASTPRNLDPSDGGRDFGDYGIVHRFTFTLVNQTDASSLVYFYVKPLGGPARGTYLIDGRMHEVGCVRLAEPYWVATYRLPPHATGASTTLTMTDGGSFYPVEFGATGSPPRAFTPRVGSPDGCRPAQALSPFAGER